MSSVSISTGGLSSLTCLEAAKLLFDNDFLSLELSGGRYSSTFVKDLEKISAISKNFTLHNYCPVPEVPFVINLASSDKSILEKSRSQVTHSLNLSGLYKLNYFAVHIGFLIDPNPKELGKTLKKENLYSKNKSMNNFYDSINKLSYIADKNNVKLLIENNVITKKNISQFGVNPLLGTSFLEIDEIMKNIPENVGLLLDVAHLNVSCNTLKLDREKEIKLLKKYTEGYHLSDNNGLTDSNSPISSESWFLPYIERDIDYKVLEVYEYDPKSLKKQIEFIQK